MKKSLVILIAAALLGLSEISAVKKNEAKCGNHYLMQYAPQICYQNIKNYTPVEKEKAEISDITSTSDEGFKPGVGISYEGKLGTKIAPGMVYTHDGDLEPGY